MKAVILAGGQGTRLSEGNENSPKTHGRNWWEANSMACYENIFFSWH